MNHNEKIRHSDVLDSKCSKKEIDKKISTIVTKAITILAIVGSLVDFLALSISSITGKDMTDSKWYHAILISVLCYSGIWGILKIRKIKKNSS